MILFCNDLLEFRKVDPDFKTEWLHAQEAGFTTGLISYESLLEGDMAKCLQLVEQSETEQLAIYRGWMLKPERYSALYASLLRKGIRLLNSPESYIHCHYLPYSFHKISSKSPKTVWNQSGREVSEESIQLLLKPFGRSPVVVKDYVKSEKHYWKEACYIPDASDTKQAIQVIRRFVELRGNELCEGLVLRQFENLMFLTNHSESGMPLTKEYRLFFLKGKLLQRYPYWSKHFYTEKDPDTSDFERLAESIESPFFTMDIAQKTNGQWIVMELGDGQVSGLPDNDFSKAFYDDLVRVMRNE